MQSFISQILKMVGPFGEKFGFFIPWGFEIRSTFYHKTAKLSFPQTELSYDIQRIKI